MRINDSSNQHLSLYHDCLYLAGASSTEYPFNPDYVRNANLAMDLVSGYIMRFDSTWSWRDHNRTTQPIADGDLTSGQSVYPLTLGHLKVLRVRVKDSDGNYHTLKPRSRRSLNDDELAATGVPTSYSKQGASIVLNPTPDYSVSTTGMELECQQPVDYFDTDDTTKEPGFAQPFHRLISLLPALDFPNVSEARKRDLRDRIGACPEPGRSGSGMLGELCNFYSQRDYDEEPVMELAKFHRGIGLL